MNNITTNDFVKAFQNVYNFDEIDESYLDNEDFLSRLEDLISDYENDEFVSKEKMAEDVRSILHFMQYGDTSDINDLDQINEDFHNRFPDGR